MPLIIDGDIVALVVMYVDEIMFYGIADVDRQPEPSGHLQRSSGCGLTFPRPEDEALESGGQDIEVPSRDQRLGVDIHKK